MVLEADIDPADLRSVRSIVSGTAPLSADDAEARLAALEQDVALEVYVTPT